MKQQPRRWEPIKFHPTKERRINQPAATLSEALARVTRLVDTAQSASALAPVTILVPSRPSGIDLRRHIARHAAAGNGVLNVTTTSLSDLAQDLFERGGSGVSSRKIFPEVWRGAVRAELRKNPGAFAAVADQPATSRALARACETLDGTRITTENPPALVGEVIRIYAGAAAAVRKDWITEAQVFERAADAIAVPAIRARLGAVIGFALPDLLPPLENHLLAAVRALPGFVEVPFSATDDVVDSARVITAPDADEECREVARQVVELVREGHPANRIGVFWDATSPYRVLLHKHLADTSIAVNGPVGRQLADTGIARSVLRLLELDRSEIDPRAVLDIIADGAIGWRDGKLPSSAQCERMFASEPLDEPLEKQTVRFIDPDAEGEVSLQATGTVFDQYVVAIGASLQLLDSADSWAAASIALVHLLEAHFAVPRSDEGVAALSQLREIATSLRFLDSVSPPPNLSAVRECVESAVSGAVARTGTIGQGVSLGALQSGVARDLDTVFIVGLAEGVTPSRQREDPLIPDAVRPAWGLPTIAQRSQARRQLFRDVAASAAKKLVLTAPRGDLRGGGDREFSRWLTQGAIASAIELGSHHAGIITGSPDLPTVPTTVEMWRLRALLAGQTAPSNEIVTIAQVVRADRRSGHFTRFTGNLYEVRDLIRATDEAISATNLEDWVSSPYFYFLRHVLGVRPWDLGREAIEPDMLEVGTIAHRILEFFALQAIAGGDSSISALLEIAQTVFSGSAQPTWIGHLWQRRKAEILRHLERWWAREVGSEAWSPRSAEASFGPHDSNDETSVSVSLPGGGEVLFRGKVDRIDHHVDGHLRVIDYKTGSNKKYVGLSATSPTGGGQLFQLPVYALFARTQAGAAPVTVGYDFIFGGGELGYEVTEAVIDEFLVDVELVVTAIANGIFPPRNSAGAFRPYASLIAPGELDELWRLLLPLPELASTARLWAEDAK